MKRTAKPDPYALADGAESEPTPSAPASSTSAPKPGLDLEPPIEPQERQPAIDPGRPAPRPSLALEDEPAAESTAKPAPKPTAKPAAKPTAKPTATKPPAPSARFTDTMQAGVHVISFSRRDVVDAEYIQQLGDDLYRFLKKHPQPKVVIDLDTVKFLSSAALGMLMMLRKAVVDKMDGTICIANVDDNLTQVFKITKLHKLMKMHDDTDKAIKSLL